MLEGPPLLGAAFAMHALRTLDLTALALLFIGNALLMTHVFMLNDRAGLQADLADPNKAAQVFTARGVGTTQLTATAAGMLIVSLLLFSRLGAMTTGLGIAVAMLSALYSLPQFHWKARPLLNSATHLTGGILHFLLGYSIGPRLDARGIAIATFFALIFVAGHLTQEIRDHDGDAANGIETNAVRFGPRRTFAASIALFTAAQLLFLTLALTGLLPRILGTILVLYPIQLYWSRQTLRAGLTYASVSRLQMRYRVLYGVIGMAIVAVLAAG